MNEILKLSEGDFCIIDKEFLDRYNAEYPPHRIFQIDILYKEENTDKRWMDGHWADEIGKGVRISSNSISYWETKYLLDKINTNKGD
jgi:hypothetical protein